MKILLSSHCFAPSTGGIETVSDLLALEFLRQGHEVRVVTQTPGPSASTFPVVRNPRTMDLMREIKWCDVLLQNNISLRTLWPCLAIRRPIFVIHQTWIQRVDGTVGWQDWAKLSALRFTRSVAISAAVAKRLQVAAPVVGNPYDDAVFHIELPEQRERELIFAGRLVSDKGVDLLIAALAKLRDKGQTPRLTVVGDGPERAKLEAQVTEARLEGQVVFAGRKGSVELARLLNKHRILVVPSRWPEPFGIVAIEGIACGCVVVGSAGGGLEEAIGPCGVTFPNGDINALTERLAELLRDPERYARFRTVAGAHLARFKKGRVAETYLELMKSAAP